jgi:hypothetical protein
VKMKLAYIVTEQGCMDPTTGAFQHISMGIRELSILFDGSICLGNIRK